jgi:glycosyl-4,4'-diaponeurosporenoate acyltransferase
MQILFLKPLKTLIVDIFSWVVLHFSIGYLSTKIPYNWLNPNLRFFQSYSWEKDGKIYERLFHVRSWKHLIPDGSKMYQGAFSIKHLPTDDVAYLTHWLKESIRSEICHWMMIFPGFFFFLWNDIMGGWLMVAYAFLNNLVPIILQRFNRPRMRKLIVQLEKSKYSAAAFIASPANRILRQIIFLKGISRKYSISPEKRTGSVGSA